MFRIIVLSLAVSAVYSASIPSGLKPVIEGRVVGGHPGTVEEFPWVVSLMSWGGHKCGAAVITETAILTAAHCVYKNTPKELEVRAGATLREKGGILIPVEKFFFYPEFSMDTMDHDMSVVFVKTPFVYSDRIQPIALPEQDEVLEVGAIGTVLGWGRTEERGPIPTVLQYLSVPILRQEDCVASYAVDTPIASGVTDSMVCAGYLEGGRDACQQDSGGPLVVNNKLHGVVSWGYGCARPNHPGIYARVAKLRKWIDGCLSK